VRCSACGEESHGTARFCSNCGAALPIVCPECGSTSSRTARFCAECRSPLAASPPTPPLSSPQEYIPGPLAEKILSSRADIEGERKLVTVLSADVANFTSMGESLDPEECFDLMQGCFDRMLAEVHGYEGTVTQFLGDGILALFGAPIAHEDHAQRAIHAALGIQQSLRAYQEELQESRGIQFRMRIGLNSGRVGVGTIGSDLSMTYTAIGDTVNLASRIQHLAEPGTVVIGENTHRLAGGYFVTRDLGRQAVQGKKAAVGVYQVVEPRRWRSRVDITAERGLGPFVGREPELATLLDRAAWGRAGRGQVVFLRGEAGMGKSRLLYECRRRLGEAVRWLEGRCISYGRDIAYFPIVDLLKDVFAIEQTDAEETILRKLEASSLGTAVADGMPYLKQLLAVDPGDATVAALDPKIRKVRVFDVLRGLCNALAQSQPVVVAVEDLHWIDPLSEEFLAYVAGGVAGHPILLVLTHRPEYAQRFGAPAHVTQIDLRSLSDGECGEVARGVLGTGGMPAELQEVILQKAEGNPFFVEEVTRSLLEVGAIRRVNAHYVLACRREEIEVPDTVQDVIAARLDRLPEAAKRTNQIASVIGREFTVRLVDRTAALPGDLGERLRELEGTDLIYQRPATRPVPGGHPEPAYTFKHALTHDVAYNSLRVARRKLLHRQVGDAIEELYPDRLAEQSETLAYHYERAEGWEKAREYLQKSGDKALAAFAPRQAIEFYDRALSAVAKSGESFSLEEAIALHSGRGQALHVTNQWNAAIESFQAMLQATRDVGDHVQQGAALFHLAHACFWAHHFEEGTDHAESARQLAIESGDPAALSSSLYMKALVAQATGDPTGAAPIAEEALRIALQARLPVCQAMALSLLGLQAHWRGEEALALAQFDEGLQIARRYLAADLLLYLLWGIGVAHSTRGEYDQGIQFLREAVELSTRMGDRIWRPRALNTLGWIYLDLGHCEQALQYNTESVIEARAVGDPEIIRNAELNLADCYLVLGRWDDAKLTLEAVQEACRRGGRLSEECSKWRYTQRLNASLGELWLSRGDWDQALAFADACVTAAEATLSRRNIVKGRRLKGEVCLAQGQLTEAEAEIEEALRVATEVGNPAQIWKTQVALGRLREVQGRREEAVAAYEEALTSVEETAAGLSDPELRETLLRSPPAAALPRETGRS
jgi:class 3 adenylate cyclase/tetratricopeptide (TPR) repeat protein